MFRYLSLILALCLLIREFDTAKILCVFPVPSLSHQIVFRALTNELAKRGHELVVVTPDPGLQKDRPPDNVTEIDTSNAYRAMAKALNAGKRKRGIVAPSNQINFKDFQFIINIESETYKNMEFAQIINDKNQKFDLIIGEAFGLFPIALAKKFNAPLIWFSSFYGSPENFEIFGAPTRHPLLYPSFFRCRFYNLSFLEKLYEIYENFRLWHVFNQVWHYEYDAMREQFGDLVPTINEFKNSVDLLFLNANPIFDGNRPVPPNIVYLGGLHMQPVKDLPNDLKSFLDKSEHGVIYVSLGTNVQVSLMDPDLLEAFLIAFESLPYDILWKFSKDDLPRIPKNAHIEKWFPQRDLLTHPSIKAFVTQGGLQSTDEAIDAGVPLVGLPALGDQWFNVEQYERLGIGIKVDIITMDAEKLIEAIKTVIENKSYRENIKKLNKLVRDQPQTPIERAVWWTEYVIRNKGAKHLRAIVADISWYDFFMLDVVLFIATLSLISLSILYFFIRRCVFLYSCSNVSKKSKTS